MNPGAFLRAFAAASSAISAFCIVSGAWLASRQRRRSGGPGPLLPVSCIKPVRGLDPGARLNFDACLRMDYPAPVQWIFAVESDRDPVVPRVAELRDAFPDADVELVVAGVAASGSQKLHNMKAALAHARHPVLCISDSDVRPGTGALRALVSELLASNAGAVCASVFYEGASNPAGRAFQAFANSDLVGILAFLERIGKPDVLIGGMHVLRRDTLAAVGGYEALGDHISDDGALGMLLWRHRRPVLGSMEPVSMTLPGATWRELVISGHRWWLMMRVSAPGRFAFSLLLFGPFYGMAWWGLAAWSGTAGPGAWLCGPGLALLHVASTAWVGRVRGPRRLRLGYAWLRPVVDWLGFFLWWGALLWPRITWRGHRYVVSADGTARRRDPAPAACQLDTRRPPP